MSENVKSLLGRYGIAPKKKLGQSFLVNESIAQDIVNSAHLKKDDIVLEIGGGFGILTRCVARSAGKVYVVEKEKALAAALRSLLREYSNIEVIEGDAMSVGLPPANKVVANLPYSISSPITFRLLNEVRFHSAVLMYQKEFAERLLSPSGSRDYSRLTIEVTYRADVEKVRNVTAREFYPMPKVDSMVVRMIPRSSGPFARDDRVFHWMIRGIYSYPNKQIRKAFRIWFRGLGYDDEVSEKLTERCANHFTGTERLRDLNLEALVNLSNSALEMIEDGMLCDPRGNTA